MTVTRVVVNASPLITLFKSQQEELLPQLFKEIVVPKGVWEEISMAGQSDLAAKMLPEAQWINYRELNAVKEHIQAWDLGIGESQVLSYAFDNPQFTAMVDDQAARKCAKTLGIPTLGTGAAIVLAKRRGLISSASSKIQALRDSGLWLSEEVVNLLKKQAGE